MKYFSFLNVVTTWKVNPCQAQATLPYCCVPIDDFYKIHHQVCFIGSPRENSLVKDVPEVL